jgi:hypothetical protein
MWKCEVRKLGRIFRKNLLKDREFYTIHQWTEYNHALVLPIAAYSLQTLIWLIDVFIDVLYKIDTQIELSSSSSSSSYFRQKNPLKKFSNKINLSFYNKAFYTLRLY